MQNIFTSIKRWASARIEADQFRESAFLVTTGLLALAAWVWVGQSVANEALQARVGLALMALIGGASWGIFRLYHHHFIQSVGLFLTAQALFIALMTFLLRDLSLGYLFLFTIVMAGSLVGWVGAAVSALGASVIEISLLHAIPVTYQNAALMPGLILLQFLTALITGQAARGLYAALEAVEISAQEAHRHAEEARMHRGELHRTLKSLDIAYVQLQRANAELLQAREIADAAVQFKKEFAAQISHELRTPLNLILGFSETMAFSQHSYGVKLPPAYLRDVTEIHRNSRHLLSLIDDILDLSKLESGRMGLRFNLIDIHDVLREVVETIQPLTQAKGLDLISDVPEQLPEVWLDRSRIYQVLLNLLGNAARLTRQGSITLRVQHRARENELLVQVQDTGPGIPADMLAQIFEEFQQVGETAGAAGTTGLGLAISKRIVELHGGHIWAESAVGAGSSFSFVLPAREPLPAQLRHPQVPYEKGRGAQPALVIIGEEGSDEVKLLQRHLDGYSLACAPAWENARRLVENVNARAIIASEPHPSTAEVSPASVPVITCPLPSSKETAQALGIAYYIRKPLTIRSLLMGLQQVAPKARSLLLIGDDPNALRLMERMTKSSGSRTYQIFRAYDAQEAAARLQAQPPDAILLDLGLANPENMALLARFRADPRASTIPVIAIGASESDEIVPNRPITLYNDQGFTPTETLNYLQAILSAVPPAKRDSGTSAPPSPAGHLGSPA